MRMRWTCATLTKFDTRDTYLCLLSWRKFFYKLYVHISFVNCLILIWWLLIVNSKLSDLYKGILKSNDETKFTDSKKTPVMTKSSTALVYSMYSHLPWWWWRCAWFWLWVKLGVWVVEWRVCVWVTWAFVDIFGTFFRGSLPFSVLCCLEKTCRGTAGQLVTSV